MVRDQFFEEAVAEAGRRKLFTQNVNFKFGMMEKKELQCWVEFQTGKKSIWDDGKWVKEEDIIKEKP